MLTAQKILPNVYRDSVALMRISAKLCELPGVIQAAMISATDGNIDLLAEAGLIENGVEAAPSDLLIAIQGQDQKSIAAALASMPAPKRERPCDLGSTS